MDLKSQSAKLQKCLGLKIPPIAVSFLASAPRDIPRIGAAEAAGCAYWKLAAEGKVFYTEASDHYNCPIGAFTHGIDLAPETAKQLEGLMETMVGLQYIKKEDIPSIPHRSQPFGAAVYAPLDKAPREPDVVLVRGNAAQMMLLAEAAQAAGAAGGRVAAMGRPTCAVLPEAMQSAQAAVSFGCAGNRVYTGAGENEAYCAIPGSKLEAVAGKLEVILRANRELKSFHETRRAAHA
ncbi:MAG: hypothetical protein A3G41_06615 [Elusimicrobia bacterium RIFCSPLOWO2_12_FULL_59_9]|nr:MAG: hypothetical protein A3G41_06615 [Elusimicrobia bacterium RIFCSPLOWO2_12_FULL_59_9]